ncbi:MULTISPECIES: PilV family protein [Thermus]|uniref:prepilin n=1 Tax=Thermus TaxID=270 RepID=UPI001F3955AE|nr:prepilin [Thermus brockianus]
MGVKGLSLLEVLLAVVLLSMVSLAFLGLQVTSLRASQSGRLTQALVREAENLLASMRANPGNIEALCRDTLSLTTATARCTYTPCAAKADGTLECPATGTAHAFRVVLEVPKDSPRLTLETVVYRP